MDGWGQPLIQPVLSHFQTSSLVQDFSKGKLQSAVSLDLGLTQDEVRLEAGGVLFPDGQHLDWQSVQEIGRQENSCFVVENNTLRKIQFFSELTGRVYSLMPTRAAPTMLVSGIPMHRIKDTDPYQDTLEKIRASRPVVGQVLDTATGLGYTAIQAARTARQVITVELDPAALQVCRLNPWSQALFTDSRISQRLGDSFEVIAEFDEASFSVVLHDPPAFSLAGDLYSADFYAQVYRVLRRKGRMFHYIGDPDSKSGRSLTAGVIRRLEQVGFQRIDRVPRAFGVAAYK